MSLPAHLESVPGAQELFDWFGYWPTFHDAEIINFDLKLGEPAHLAIHAWEMTNQVDANGFYLQTKHVAVEFVLEGITVVDLQGDPWDYSIIFELSIKKSEAGFSLDICPSYGIAGTIEAQRLAVRIRPGKPGL